MSTNHNARKWGTPETRQKPDRSEYRVRPGLKTKTKNIKRKDGKETRIEEKRNKEEEENK